MKIILQNTNKINGMPLYIINSAGIAYHQNEVLYIIIAKVFLIHAKA